MGIELDGLASFLAAATDTHMNKGRRDDHASAKLPEDSEDGVVRGDVGGNHNRREDSDGAGDQHDE